MSWRNETACAPFKYTCGYCGCFVAASKGFPHNQDASQRIAICPNCDRPTYRDKNGRYIPDVAPGNEVEHLPEALKSLYFEARNCVAIGSYTGSVLLSRKLLMNIGVNLEAEPGKPFVYYIKYLAEKGYIPPNGHGWVDHIRKKGNEATHEIALMSKDDAIELIAFSEMLMKFIYEFPNKIPSE